MADQAKTGPTPGAPNSSQPPIKTTTDTKPAAAPIAAATAPIEPKKN